MRKLNLFLICWLFTAFSFAQTSPSIDFTELSTPSTNLHFIPNQNQFHPNVQFLCQLGVTDRVYLEDDGFTFVFHEHQNFFHNHGDQDHDDHEGCNHDEDQIVQAHAYKVEFVGAQKVIPNGDEKMSHHLNYFLGNDESKWASNVPVFQMAEYKDLYNGIHLKTYSQEGRFKYDFIIEAGVDPSQIELKYNGVDQIRVHNDELNIPAAGKIIRESKPYAYQIIDGEKIEVACQYKVDGNIVKYEFPEDYDSSIQLIIDPTIIGSTLTGAPTSGGFGHTGAFDNEGNMYLGGISFGSDYPATIGAFELNFAGGNQDIAVSKFNPNGSQIIYATYLGTDENDWPHSIIVDNNQQLCVFGTTEGDNYPVTNNAYSTSRNGNIDMVITRINQDGSALIGSTYMGGSESDGQNQSSLNTNYGEEYRGEINIDALGNIFIASCSSSPNFPVSSNAYQTQLSNSSGTRQDGVVFKMNSDLSVLFWSTFLGADDADVVSSLRINDNGEIYVTGTAGDQTFPTTAGSIQADWPGGQESAFIAVLSSNGANLLRSTFWGTSGIDHAYFLDLDEEENVHIYGQTTGNMLITPNTYFNNVGSRQFISGLTSDLTGVAYSTVVGTGPLSSSNYDFVPVAFMVDKCNGIYFSGYYGKAGLPVTNDAILSSYPDDVFYLGVLSPLAEEMTFGSYFGAASHVDGGTSRFDKAGIVYQAVCSCQWSGELNTTPGAFAETQTAGCNAGIFKIDFDIETVTSDIFVTPSGSGCAPFDVDFRYAGTDGVSYFWDFGGFGTSTERNPSFTFPIPGSFEVMMIAENMNSCNARDTSFVVIDVLGGNITTQEIGFCENDNNVFLDASVLNGTYEWENGSDVPTLEVTQPGTYWVDVSLDGCSSRDSFIVRLIENDFNLGDDITTCVIDYFELDANDPSLLSYQWNTGQTTSLVEIEESGEYTITVTDLEGCYYIDTIDISITESFELDFGPDTTICPGEVLILDPELDEANYEWQDGSDESTFEVSEPGVYTLSANLDACVDDTEINVSYSQIEFSLPGDEEICGETEFTIDASQNLGADSEGVFFQWNTGDIGAELTVTDSDDYIVAATDIYGCTILDTMEVLIGQYPNPNLFDLIVCPNSDLEVEVNIDDADFEWQDGSTQSSLDITGEGEYWVNIIDQHCEFRDTFQVSFFDSLNVMLEVTDILCANDLNGAIEVTSSTPDSEYLWSNGSTENIINDLGPGLYILETKDVFGCTYLDSINLEPPSAVGMVTSFSSHDCDGETIGVLQITETTTENPPVEFFVDGVSYGDTTTISQLGIGNHLIEMVDDNDCIVESDFTINAATPNLLDAGEDQIIEIGTFTDIEGTISNSNNMEFSWTPPEDLNCPECISTAARPFESTNYLLSATNILTGCVLTDDVFIEVREKEAIFIPNIFSPNSFDENNSFSVFSKSARLDVLNLKIYDRWGSLIYESENFDTNKPDQGWNGRFQGEVVQPGVYVYLAEVLMYTGEKKFYSGDITVVD